MIKTSNSQRIHSHCLLNNATCRILGLFVLVTLLSTTFPSNGLSYDPPIGIPEPSFGIDETVANVYGAGYYTHYVDNTHPNADNSNDPSSPTAPLANIFYTGSTLTLPAGSVMEIHGGPYSYDSWRKIIASGTASQPVFIRGTDPVNPIRFEATDGSSDWRLESCSYLIIENIEFYDGAHPVLRDEGSTDHHISYRNLHIHGVSNTTYYPIGAVISGLGEDIVVYNCEINTIWKGAELDCHGVTPGSGSVSWWILENNIYDLSGDCFQATHNAAVHPTHLYVGRNNMHETRENAIDIKQAKNVIVSQNELWGFSEAICEGCGNGSDGSAVVVNNKNDYPGKENLWFLFNDIHSSVNGIRFQDDAYAIGNVIHDVEEHGLIQWHADWSHIVGNTFVDATDGIEMAAWGQPETSYMNIYNNVIVNSDTTIQIKLQSVADRCDMQNNLIWNGGDSTIIRWGSAYTIDESSDITNIPNTGENSLFEDPLFVDAGNDNYDITSSSPAKDAGATNSVYDTFYTLYGINIEKDFDGSSRPVNSIWDIGPYEYGGTTSTTTTTTTTGGSTTTTTTTTTTGGATTTTTTTTTTGGASTTTTTVTTTTSGDAFLESDGQVVMEAENFHSNTARQSDGPWTEETSKSGYVGDSYMDAPSDADGNGTWNTSPTSGAEIAYDVDFFTAGTYYIWIRCYMTSSGTNSVYVGMDGSQIGSGYMGSDNYNVWHWIVYGTTVYISAETHTIQFRRRERDVCIDRILLTTDSEYTPSGDGPDESPRGGGSTTTTTTTTTTTSGPSDDVADSDIAVDGTVSGNYTDTQTSNDTYESIEERESGGKPSNRYTYLEHKWTIDVTGGTSVMFYVEAYHTSNSEGDDFVFAYSTNDEDYTNMVTVTKTSDDDNYQSYALPGSLSGTVYIRVKDTDQTQGNRNKDLIYIDHMYIHSDVSKGIPDDGYPAEVIVPSQIKLYKNYPNPFNPSTTIRYDLYESGHVNLAVYDMMGRTIATLVNSVQSAGTYTFEWRAVDSNGNHLPSGVYMCRLTVGSHIKIMKMVYMR